MARQPRTQPLGLHRVLAHRPLGILRVAAQRGRFDLRCENPCHRARTGSWPPGTPPRRDRTRRGTMATDGSTAAAGPCRRSGIVSGSRLSRQNALSVALREHVVQLQEIDDAAPAVMGRGIEPRGDQIHHFAAHRHLLGDELRGQLDQHDGRCFQRLEESGREADGDAIALPECLRCPTRIGILRTGRSLPAGPM